jgi:hypothetical protein
MVTISFRMWRDVQELSMQSHIKSHCKHFCETSHIISSICYGSNRMKQPLTQQTSMQVLGTMSRGRLISNFRNITWPSHLSDFVVPNCFCCGYVRSKVYGKCPASTNDLKQKIQEYTVFMGPLGATTYNLSIVTALV